MIKPVSAIGISIFIPSTVRAKCVALFHLSFSIA